MISSMRLVGTSIRCACGAVGIEALGRPIVGVVCYCDDCQTAGQRIERMPGASPFRGNDGGTPLIVYRRDRIRDLHGRDHLQQMKQLNSSATNRWVARCCNGAMMMDFDDGKHWVDIYQARFESDPPPPPVSSSD
ncbi:hypothetical protein [Rhizobium fabae]|uniref:CENP-V/GFA domain-containing protein n=1 Tax=Rhizobium fabae TaxID=573179 RepID=A0A7W6FMP2_9HYPH|nr:hypothetical protein [Rhizobium fabae]MBB3919475.1 hypothetical protein [Rhizobium fabae]